jgi:putative membrane protein insertion efficiency factor
VLLLLVRFYITFLSPFFGGSCRFHPSCSNYAHEAIARHGARRGFVLSLKRLLRCNPFVKGGFDPVPELASGSEQLEQAQGWPFIRLSGTQDRRLVHASRTQRKQESAQ